jgi:hypothetical protein
LLREQKIMATVTRCAPDKVRAHKSITRAALLAALTAGVAALGYARPAAASFDDGAGASCGDWSVSDSAGATGSSDSGVTFSVDADGCFGAAQDDGPITLTDGCNAGDDCGVLLLASDSGTGGDSGSGDSDGGTVPFDSDRYFGHNGSGQVTPDRVGIPEPGTFAMLAFAAGGLLTRRAIKRPA